MSSVNRIVIVISNRIDYVSQGVIKRVELSKALCQGFHWSGLFWKNERIRESGKIMVEI